MREQKQEGPKPSQDVSEQTDAPSPSNINSIMQTYALPSPVVRLDKTDAINNVFDRHISDAIDNLKTSGELLSAKVAYEQRSYLLADIKQKEIEKATLSSHFTDKKIADLIQEVNNISTDEVDSADNAGRTFAEKVRSAIETHVNNTFAAMRRDVDTLQTELVENYNSALERKVTEDLATFAPSILAKGLTGTPTLIEEVTKFIKNHSTKLTNEALTLARKSAPDYVNTAERKALLKSALKFDSTIQSITETIEKQVALEKKTFTDKLLEAFKTLVRKDIIKDGLVALLAPVNGIEPTSLIRGKIEDAVNSARLINDAVSSTDSSRPSFLDANNARDLLQETIADKKTLENFKKDLYNEAERKLPELQAEYSVKLNLLKEAKLEELRQQARRFLSAVENQDTLRDDPTHTTKPEQRPIDLVTNLLRDKLTISADDIRNKIGAPDALQDEDLIKLWDKALADNPFNPTHVSQKKEELIKNVAIGAVKEWIEKRATIAKPEFANEHDWCTQKAADGVIKTIIWSVPGMAISYLYLSDPHFTFGIVYAGALAAGWTLVEALYRPPNVNLPGHVSFNAFREAEPATYNDVRNLLYGLQKFYEGPSQSKQRNEFLQQIKQEIGTVNRMRNPEDSLQPDFFDTLVKRLEQNRPRKLFIFRT